MRRTGLVFHEHYLWHDPGPHASVIPADGLAEPGPYAESAERVRRICSLIDVSALGEHLVMLRPRPATRAELLRVHSDAYLDRVAHLAAIGHGDAGFYGPVGASSDAIAALAAGGCVVAIDAVLRREVDNAYALVRPPVHRAAVRWMKWVGRMRAAATSPGTGYCRSHRAARAIRPRSANAGHQ